MVAVPQFGNRKIPCGYPTESWRRLRCQIESGDELWLFTSPTDHWEHLAGRRCVALVRQRRIIARVVTRMN